MLNRSGRAAGALATMLLHLKNILTAPEIDTARLLLGPQAAWIDGRSSAGVQALGAGGKKLVLLCRSGVRSIAAAQRAIDPVDRQ